MFRNLNCGRLQADEIWSFAHANAKCVKPEHIEDSAYAGDAWTWTAIDADTKSVPRWMIGGRDIAAACDFIADLSARLGGEYNSRLMASRSI